MPYRDPKCVFVADDAARATVVANWLRHQGVPARVMDTMTQGGLEGLTGWTGISSRGMEVWVQHPDDIQLGKKLVAQHEHSATRQQALTPTVLARCEDCGETSRFAGEQRGTIQDCPFCGRYMDVPEDDDPTLAGPGDERGDVWQAQEGEVVWPFRLRYLQKPIILLILAFLAWYLVMMLMTALDLMIGG